MCYTTVPGLDSLAADIAGPDLRRDAASQRSKRKAMNEHLLKRNEFFEENFPDLDMADTVLEAKSFESCSFTQCSFNEAVLKQCKFVDCEFRSCDLSNAKLPGTKFTGAVFVECKLLGVDWTRADWPRYAAPGKLAFRKSLLDYCNFFGLSLPELVMEECRVVGADFREADFTKASFVYSVFTETMFGRTKLAKADFSEATGYALDIRDNVIKGARFTRSEAIGLLYGLEIELVD
jgi:uncharacterized protein YjbI with pentapeptide repeats